MTNTNDILKRLRAAGTPPTWLAWPATAFAPRNITELASKLWSTNVLEARILALS